MTTEKIGRHEMKKEIVQCPMCREQQEVEECNFATVRKVVKGKMYVCCCEVQEKKVNNL